MDPFCFCTSFRMTAGHLRRHSNGLKSVAVHVSHPPRESSPLASTYPYPSGSRKATSSRTCVGRRCKSSIKQQTSSRTSRTSDLLPRPMVGSFKREWALRGVMKPFRPGRIWQTAWILPCNFWKTAKGIACLLRASHIAMRYLAALLSVRRTLWCRPSKNKRIERCLVRVS
jgi:hypothetical protein